MAPAGRATQWHTAVLLFCLWGISDSILFSQAPKENKAAGLKSQTIFRVPVQVVVVNAIVTDKSGNPVTDLTSKDFRVSDDGKPQEIQTFALESYGYEEEVAATAPAMAENSTPAAPRYISTPNTSRPRMISLVIDDLTMESVVNFPRTIEALRQYILKDMGPRDQVALLSGSGRLQVPFTDNRQHLLDEIALLFKKLDYVPPARSTCPKLTDLEAWRFADAMHEFQVDRNKIISETITCLNLPQKKSSEITAEHFARTAAMQQNQILQLQTHRLLYTLQLHLRALRHFEGTKSVVFFSDGFLAEKDSPSAYQFQELIDLALRSGVLLNTVSIRGVQYEGQDGIA